MVEVDDMVGDMVVADMVGDMAVADMVVDMAVADVVAEVARAHPQKPSQSNLLRSVRSNLFYV